MFSEPSDSLFIDIYCFCSTLLKVILEYFEIVKAKFLHTANLQSLEEPGIGNDNTEIIWRTDIIS